MDILIIRHGDAVEDAPGLGDAGRWLSGDGRSVTRRVASWLAERDEHRPTAIWTSPLVRAVQTAEIVASASMLTGEVTVCGALATGGDPREVLRLLQRARRQPNATIALVGHEPSLSTLAMSMVPDLAWPGFKKSGVLGIRWADDGSPVFRFALRPKDLRVETDSSKLS